MRTSQTRAGARAALTLAAIATVALALATGGAQAAPPAGAVAAHARPPGGPHQIRHVFVIVLENESEATTFGAGSPAPYLSQTLPAAGAFVPNYYGVGHHSLDNYIAMISGQAPNTDTQLDCGVFADFGAGSIGSYGQQPGTGCVYPSDVPTITTQLAAAGDTWRSYNEDMGADPTREPAVCAHPVLGAADNTEAATATDMYASRHDPFVYFHAIIDHATLCDSHVVNLDLLPHDLAHVSSTRSYTFITPDLCDDGHDSPCADGEPGGLAQADSFLRTWVPKITRSPAFRQDGLLVITFDEAAGADASSCCGEIAGPGAALPGLTGPGGGRVGAVLLSPCIAPGTVTQTAYDHYALLGSVENLFGLSHLGYAGLPGETYFGSDVYNRPCGPAPPVIHALRVSFSSGSGPRATLHWRASTSGGTALAYSQVQQRRGGRWRTVLARTKRTVFSLATVSGRTYEFRVRGVDLAGEAGRWTAALRFA
jgi:phosphatidylinositol-3-phosphatase